MAKRGLENNIQHGNNQFYTQVFKTIIWKLHKVSVIEHWQHTFYVYDDNNIITKACVETLEP